MTDRETTVAFLYGMLAQGVQLIGAGGDLDEIGSGLGACGALLHTLTDDGMTDEEFDRIALMGEEFLLLGHDPDLDFDDEDDDEDDDDEEVDLDLQ